MIGPYGLETRAIQVLKIMMKFLSLRIHGSIHKVKFDNKIISVSIEFWKKVFLIKKEFEKTCSVRNKEDEESEDYDVHDSYELGVF